MSVTRLSPTANLIAGLIQEGMQCGMCREGDEWDIAFEIGALRRYLGGIRIP
jgi:hypothetical protein